jgi:putative membrane protein
MNSEPKWYREGEEPDYRFSLANERTFLAWVRTALAILAGAILLHEFAAKLRPHSVIATISIALAILSAVLGAGSYERWKGTEIAMRHSRPLPFSRLFLLLPAAVLALSTVAALLLVLQ